LNRPRLSSFVLQHVRKRDRNSQLALKIDSPGNVECFEILDASTMAGSISLRVGAPIRRMFISNSSCVGESVLIHSTMQPIGAYLENLQSSLNTLRAISRHGIQHRPVVEEGRCQQTEKIDVYSLDAYRPIPTAVAPSATAFSTSDARRTPPSIKISKFGLGNILRFFSSSTTSTKTSIPDLANSYIYKRI
jgi:hypothetical protein